MTTATKRLSVPVTEAQKARIAKKAKDAKLTMNEFVRRAAEAYEPDDEKIPDGLIDQLKRTAQKASQAIDTVIALVDESNARIEGLEAKAVSARCEPRKLPEFH